MFLVLSSMMVLDVCAESFADFFVNFFYDTNNQAKKVLYPITTPSNYTRVKSGWQTITLKDKNKIALLYSDSLDAITTYPSLKPVVIDLKNKSGQAYTFSTVGKSWLLTNITSSPSSSFTDTEFMTFLERFCGDKDFQKKRVIFPLKEVLVSGEDKTSEVSSRLFMPQNWMHIDFFASFQQMSWFRTGEDSSANRQILVYENGKKSVLYNFIRIRNNWFLIEVNRYKN